MNRTERGSRHYFIEMMGALLLYAACLVGRKSASGDLKTALTLAGIIPVWLIGLAVVRFYRSADEYLRHKMLLGLAMGGGLTFLLLMSYVQLQSLGLPSLSGRWVWLVPGFACAFCSMGLSMRDYVSVFGLARTLRFAAMAIFLITVPTLLYALAAPALGWPHKPGFLVLFATMIFLAINGYCIFAKRCRG